MNKDHNYLKKLIDFSLEHKGESLEVVVAHDDLCNFWNNNKCNCNPIIYPVNKKDFLNSQGEKCSNQKQI